jgi:acyl-CoA synthetase (AMP-forming)/AMP-acid ligase II
MIERRFHATSFHYSPAPIFHVAGMVFPMASIARGSTSLVLGEFDPAVVLRWMRGGQLNSCFLVPTMISTLLQHPDLELGDYAAIESIAYGAAPMTVTLLRRAIDAFHCEFMHMFGAGTEAGLQALLTPEDHRRALDGHEHLLGSIGKPAFGVELRIVDSEMNDVPVGTVGEIATRAEAIMAGYLDQPELTAKTVVDGWFRGGDLARMDEDGYLYLSGRSTDMIIRGGENIYPMEIESVLAEFPDVVEYAVVGAPDEHWGEIVRAHLVVRDAQTFDVDALTAFCRGRLAGYKVPAEFVLEDALPKNASGKVLKRDLRGANA